MAEIDDMCSLALAFASMRGTAEFALLEDLVRIAQKDFGFLLGVEEAELILRTCAEFELHYPEGVHACWVCRKRSAASMIDETKD